MEPFESWLLKKYRADYPAMVGDMGAPEDMIYGASVYELAGK
jgi:hypothetical protein